MAEYLLVVASVLGITLIVIGLRGRRIDKHPLCAQCGFDLIGVIIGRKMCRECGADVSGLAIRVGHRERRTGMLYAGTALAAPALLIVTSIVYVQVRGIDITPHKPGWWLVYELDTGGETEAKAFAELCRRFQKDELSSQRISEVADYCLTRQAIRSIPWNRAWGSYIETARGAGKLSDEQWTRYATQAFKVTMSSDRTQRIGSPLTLSIHVERLRVTGVTFTAGVSWSNVTIDHSPLPTPALKLAHRFEFGRGEVQSAARYEAKVEGDITRDLPLGQRDIAASIILTIDDGDKRRPTLGRYRYDVRTTCAFEPATYSSAQTR